ncbi:MAG: hypothetical protein AAGF90_14575 [Pseudomonadota bacterium]
MKLQNLSCDATELEFEGLNARSVIEGDFAGGTDRFEGATGARRVISTKGFDAGKGRLTFAEDNQSSLKPKGRNPCSAPRSQP